MKKLFLLFAALTCCFAMKAQSVTYEPIMSIPSPINSDAVYYLGYQDGQDFYLHTSETTSGQMQLSKNPENPVGYKFQSMKIGESTIFVAHSGETNDTYLSINTQGVSYGTFSPMSSTATFSLSIVNGDISSAAASGYTVCHDGNNIITTHTGTSEGNLRFFVKLSKPSYNINVSVTPEGAGSATATIGGEQVESAVEGTEITITATPNAGSKFVNWTENNDVVSTANPYTFTLTTDRNLVANFSRQYDFSATCTSGQTLYYKIIDAEKHWVSIVAPSNDIWDHGWDGFTKPAGNITLPETVTHNDISYTVKEIGNFAFSKCIDLTGSLIIPNSVTSIGEEAFFECSGFTGSLTIGSSVESIGRFAFELCSNFTGSLTIPNSVTSIGQSAFHNCKGFTGSLIIGSSVTNIGDYAFNFCSGFSKIILKPATPPTLGNNAFSKMSNLQTITVPCGAKTAYDAWGSSIADKTVHDFVYDLTVASANTDFGSASITQQPDCDNHSQAKVTATPNDGYKFVNWTENGVEVSTENPYTFEITTDRNLVANFSKQYDFSAACTTGQTLYYRIIDAEKHWVSIVAPNNETWDLCWDGFTKPEGNITLPETVTHNDISYTVKEIGICAFSLCDGLTGSLSIPNSVTSIGADAFSDCSGFTGSLIIPNSVTSIGADAFFDCSGFTGSLTIPNSVTSIGDAAFGYCSGFTGSLIIGNSVTSIGEKAFELCSNFTGSLNIPNSVTSIGGRAFYGCKGFTGSLTIGSSVTSIGDNAFESCSGFTNIIAKPATPPTLGNNAFLYMSNLQTITVPCGNYEDYDITWRISFDGKLVGDFVYDLTVASANNGFGSASITQQPDCSTPAKVTATPNDGYKFVNWTENGVEVSTENPYTFGMDTDRNLVANFTVTGQYDFSAACTTGQTLYYRIIDAEKHWVSIVAPNNDTWDYGWNGFTKPAGNITLPETVTHNDISYTVKEIGNYAFSLCNGLTGSLSIPNSVTSIGDGAFNSCSNFTGSLTIPNSVTSIGVGAFQGCSGFTGSLIIGSSVTSIEDYAYMDCSGFSKIILKPATPPTLGDNAFRYMSKLETITVPCDKHRIYSLTLGWKNYAEKLVDGFVYDLTVASANTDFGSANITQQPDCSTEAIVTATPNDGCKFVNWTENGVEVSTENPYTFKMTTDHNLVANFVENEIKITANRDPDHKQNYYSTFYSSEADYQVPSDVTAYTGKVEDSTSEPNTSVLKLTAIEDNIIPASQGVILKLTTNDNTETQKQFVITLTTEAGTWSGTNALTGTDEATTLGENDYALSLGQNGVGFYLWSGKEIGAHKAYLTLDDNDDNEGGNAKAFTFQFEDDEATSIHNSQFIIHNSENDVMYNLNGMRVNENYKGVVIRNGNKVLQK